MVGNWVLHNQSAEAKAENLAVEPGDTIDFIVSIHESLNNNDFLWSPVIRMVGPTGIRAANGYGMPIVVHMRSSTTAKLPYGRDEAAIFFNEILPAAPDVDVQIAHLAGAGGYEVPAGDHAVTIDFLDEGKHVITGLTKKMTINVPPNGADKVVYVSDKSTTTQNL